MLRVGYQSYVYKLSCTTQVQQETPEKLALPLEDVFVPQKNLLWMYFNRYNSFWRRDIKWMLYSSLNKEEVKLLYWQIMHAVQFTVLHILAQMYDNSLKHWFFHLMHRWKQEVMPPQNLRWTRGQRCLQRTDWPIHPLSPQNPLRWLATRPSLQVLYK